jgi:hypothetical protein
VVLVAITQVVERVMRIFLLGQEAPEGLAAAVAVVVVDKKRLRDKVLLVAVAAVQKAVAAVVQALPT